MLKLHTPETIHSLRHAPSWLLLAFAAGSVNGTALLACERFVTHVTGTATRIGVDAGAWWLVLDYALVLGSFLLGAMSSTLALGARTARGKEPLWSAPLVVVAALLGAVAISGRLGALGLFGESVEEPGDFVMLSVVAFAMGLMNAAVATTTGLAVRTTHMTGPTTDLGIHLATACFERGQARRDALRGAALRGGKLVAFIGGGGVALPLATSFQYLAFLLPAAIVLAAAALSFVPSWSPRDLARDPATA